MPNPVHAILSACDIGSLHLRNRLAVAPMTRVSATEDGFITKSIQDYYLRFAKGGFGLLITEGLYPDEAFSQGYLFQPGMANNEQAKAWRVATSAVQASGAKFIAQLMHAGALSQGNRYKNGTVGPSAIQPKGLQMGFYRGEGKYPTPAEITDSQIQDVVQGFADAAVRAHRIAGFDGVEIHGANGYLLDQFLTEFSNQRSDRWGGAVAGRVSLLTTTVTAVKKAVGEQVPVGIRISQGKVNDFANKWAGRERDAEVIFGSLEAAGVDYIHVTEFEAWKPAFEGGSDSLVALARRFAPKTRIIANGSLHSVDRAVETWGLGADVLAMGRGALANPDLPQRFEGNIPLRDFDSAILGPMANIKDSELALMPA